MSDEDLWGTSSDIVSDYEGMVVDAWFNVDTNIPNSPTFMWLKMSTDNTQHEVVTEKYNCGPDWISTDGGETITHPTKKKIGGNSQAGIFITRAIELAGETLRERGLPPTTAAAWLGTKWYLEATERKGKLRDGTEFRSVRNYPVKFLGVEDDYAGKVNGEVVNAESTIVGEGHQPALIDVPASPLMQIIKDLAKDLTHEQWVDSVLQVDGVLSDDDLIRQLPDSTEVGLYERLRNG